MPETGPQGQRSADHDGAVTPATTTAAGSSAPAGPPPAETSPAASSPAVERMQRFSAANMIRSLVPLVVICLVLVGWSALKYDGGDPVRTVETTSAERAAAEVAGYQLLVPRGLSDQWRATSVRTNAGAASAGDPVSLQIGWYTPAEDFAEYVVSDDPRDRQLTDVLDHATADGTAQVSGQSWDRLATRRGETILRRTEGTATLLVTGSASDAELTTLAASLQPYSP